MNWFKLWLKGFYLQSKLTQKQLRYAPFLPLLKEYGAFLIMALGAAFLLPFSPIFFLIGCTKRYWWVLWSWVDGAYIASRWLRTCFKEQWALEYAHQWMESRRKALLPDSGENE